PHGALFEGFRNQALDARGYFENRANPKNPNKRNQFGAQMDGPLFIPRLYDGHNRTFFMAAYEGVRAKSQTAGFASVPTTLMRQGTFSEFSGTIKNPLTGQPFSGNVVPSSQISPIAQKLLQYYPEPNRPGTTSNLQSNAAGSDDID